jgi:excisionase family DNA binding protein
MSPLLNIDTAARLLGISPWTVRDYVATRKLRPVRIGRRVLLEEQELERFVRANKPIPETTGKENLWR